MFQDYENQNNNKFNGFSVTLKDLLSAGACFEGYNKVVRALQGKEFTPEDADLDHYLHFKHSEPISLLSILESNGFNDTIWALRCLKDKDREIRLYAVCCARQVEHLMADERSKNVLLVAEKYANGEASKEELEDARAAAYAGARAARAAAASYDAARAAYYTAYYADAADAAYNASYAAPYVAAAARAAAAAYNAAREAQKEVLIKMLKVEAPWQVKQIESKLIYIDKVPSQSRITELIYKGRYNMGYYDYGQASLDKLLGKTLKDCFFNQ